MELYFVFVLDKLIPLCCESKGTINKVPPLELEACGLRSVQRSSLLPLIFLATACCTLPQYLTNFTVVVLSGVATIVASASFYYHRGISEHSRSIARLLSGVSWLRP